MYRRGFRPPPPFTSGAEENAHLGHGDVLPRVTEGVESASGPMEAPSLAQLQRLFCQIRKSMSW